MIALEIERDFILDPNCILYLPLWKRDNSSFISDDRYGRPCTVTGATWGIQGRTFDGSDDIIDLGEVTEAEFTTGDFTLLAWIKMTTLATRAIISNGGWNAYGFHFYIVDDGTIRLETASAGSTSNKDSATGQIAANQWYMVGATRTGTSGYIYKNGIDVSVSGSCEATIAASTANLMVARRGGFGEQFFSGIIGEVLIYNRLLNAIEVKNYTEATKWRFV